MIHKFPPFAAVVAALTLTSPLVSAQDPVVTFTNPSGYVKHTFDVGFNLVGIGLHERAVFKGVIEGEAGNVITDSDAAFDTILTDANATYILEITSGAQLGAVAEITGSTATTVTLDGAVGAGVGANFTIRPAKTLNSIFGTSLDGAGFDPSNADKVWIANPDGTYAQYFYSTSGSDFRPVTNAFSSPPKPIAVFYPDAMFVEIKSTQKNITLFGDVKVVPTVVSANQGLNLVRVSSPAGQTLAESKLELFLKHAEGFDPSTGDKVWLPNGPGWTKYVYAAQYSQWKLASNIFGSDQGGVQLPSAVLIERLNTQPDTAGLFDLPDAFDNY